MNIIKRNKSSGTDPILNKFIENCPDNLIYVIVLLFNIILGSGFIPTDWTLGIVKVLYKNKGDTNNINNYRGITPFCCLVKLYTSVINGKLYT